MGGDFSIDFFKNFLYDISRGDTKEGSEKAREL
jgi:hypothetical protein